MFSPSNESFNPNQFNSSSVFLLISYDFPMVSDDSKIYFPSVQTYQVHSTKFSVQVIPITRNCFQSPLCSELNLNTQKNVSKAAALYVNDTKRLWDKVYWTFTEWKKYVELPDSTVGLKDLTATEFSIRVPSVSFFIERFPALTQNPATTQVVCSLSYTLLLLRQWHRYIKWR